MIRILCFFSISFFLWSSQAFALDLDWGGQFRSGSDWVWNYTMGNDMGRDPLRDGVGGYYIPGGGRENVHFESLFLMLRPSIVINDNIYLKSELWFGDPIYGMFGSGLPYDTSQRNYSSTQQRGATVSAQRFWVEFLTDLGTLQVGRVPLNFGLGIVWNDGENTSWSRYPSSGDAVRMISRFGSFVFIPSVIKYSVGNSIGGSCPNPIGGSGLQHCTGNSSSTGGSPSPQGPSGTDDLTDYSFMFMYENPNEEMAMGLNFIKRIGGAGFDSTTTADGQTQGSHLGVTGGPASMNYTTWDIFAKKKLGDFSIAVEFPITTGYIGDTKYNSWSVASEVDWKISDLWSVGLKAGRASGSPNFSPTKDATTGTTTIDPKSYKGFYFHPDYRLGLIMFQYQLSHFAGPNSLNNSGTNPSDLQSPYDNPITNAVYAAVSGSVRPGRWGFHGTFIYARALEIADAGSAHFNSWDRAYYLSVASQGSKTLGFEFDLGISFKWDDNMSLRVDGGLFKPGGFYSFSNSSVVNSLGLVWASALKATIDF